MQPPPNIAPFPGRRVREASRASLSAERLEEVVMPVVAVGVSLVIWAMVVHALWQLAAGAF